MPIAQTRRRFLNTLSLAGVAGLLGARPALAGEGALETTTVRLGKPPAICIAPQFISEALLRAEGFTDIRYIEEPPTDTEPLAHGKVDFDSNYASTAPTGVFSTSSNAS
jgi:NitT/TauT family transport system substrate-binding protein